MEETDEMKRTSGAMLSTLKAVLSSEELLPGLTLNPNHNPNSKPKPHLNPNPKP